MPKQPGISGLAAIGKHVLKTEGKTWGKRMFKALEMGVRDEWLILVLGGMHGILDQNYTGDITIAMSPSLGQYLKILKDPTLEEFNQFILNGQRATWPRLTAIYIQTKIGQTLEQCNMRLERRRGKFASNGIRLVA